MKAWKGALLLGAALLACKKSDESGRGLVGDRDCEAELHATEEWLRLVIDDGDGGTFGRPPGFQGVLRDAASAWTEPAPYAVITPDSSQIDGVSAGEGIEQLSMIMRGKMQIFEQLQGAEKEKPWLILEVDRRVSWQRVVAFVGVAREANLKGVQFAFEAKGLAPPPPRSAAHGDLVQSRDASGPILNVTLDPTLRVSPLHECKNRPSVDMTGNAQAELQRIQLAITACGCRADRDAIKEAVWLALERDRNPPRSYVKVPLGEPEQQDARRIRLPTSTPWGEAHERVVGAAKTPVVFEVAK